MTWRVRRSPYNGLQRLGSVRSTEASDFQRPPRRPRRAAHRRRVRLAAGRVKLTLDASRPRIGGHDGSAAPTAVKRRVPRPSAALHERPVTDTTPRYAPIPDSVTRRS
jgi:hypothetical protein